MKNAFETAATTLLTGCAFSEAGFRGGSPQTGRRLAPTGRYRAKLIGNGLRELDRFLCVLIDPASGAAQRSNVLGRRSSADKLIAIGADIDRFCDRSVRLRALDRSRNCLVYTSGRVVRGDYRGARFLTAGWPERAARCASLQRFAIGSELTVKDIDLQDTCTFYRAIVADLAKLAADE